MSKPAILIYRQQDLLFRQIQHARTFYSRLTGLLFSARPNPDQGLLITPCHQVHTLGMRFPIDVLFLNADGSIMQCVPGLQPFRTAGIKGARHTLELASGSIEHHALRPGQRLQWRTEAPHEKSR